MVDVNRVYNSAYERASRAYHTGRTPLPPDLIAKRKAQDAVMSERHHNFDLQAQDNVAKSERPHFAVVGEGTRSANDAFREGYDHINWSS